MIKADMDLLILVPHATCAGLCAYCCNAVPIDIVLTHVNLDVVGVLNHLLIEPLMVQRWSQVSILCLDLLRLGL